MELSIKLVYIATVFAAFALFSDDVKKLAYRLGFSIVFLCSAFLNYLINVVK